METEGKLSLVWFTLQLFELDEMVQAAQNLVRDAPEPCPVHMPGVMVMIWLEFPKSHLIFFKLLHMHILLNQLSLVKNAYNLMHCICIHLLEVFHIL